MSFKPILIHSCHRASIEVGPLDCSCKRHVTKKRAEELVREGLADYRSSSSGRVNNGEIVLHKQERFPPARTIDAAAIRSAYILGNTYEQQRIEVYREEGMSERAKLRRRAALTQVELAHLTEIHAPQICLWERGHIDLRPEQVERIAAVLKEHLGATPYFDEIGELVSVLASSSHGGRSRTSPLK
jgi:Helix-turn-helix domain